ncbi:MAG: transcriptional regulator [Parcubacteria group bacterium GW2011_GWA2_49_9]|nr:MAG: transcriptional regulator [Parcubacteria group bacterium GW2011_GWA2_49_9]
MSGHNKWSQIKLKKGKTDAKKSQVFSKYAKLIANEARMAKGNKDAPSLRAAIERARKENMPSDNIERAIKKATEGGGALEAIMYEGYGPGGVALLIEVLTDSRNRSAGEIKHLLAENGGNLAGPGAAVWAFEKVDHNANTTNRNANSANENSKWRATTTVPLEDADLEKLDKLVEALEANEDVQEVITNAE